MESIFKKKTQHKYGPFQMEELNNASKTLLANIRFASLEQEVRSIVVTSSNPNEGKTTVATNLACAIASSGKKVLLVDTDMRRKSIAHILDIHPEHGVYSVLSGEVKLNQAVVRTQYENIFFLDCESGIANPPDVLSTKRFAALVETLRTNFDFVIFDTPPLCAFIDGALIAHVCDGVLYVVRANYVKRAEVLAGLEQLKVADARVLGSVLTFTDREDSDYYYYSYYNDEGKRVRRDKKQPAEEPQLPVMRVTNDLADDDINEWSTEAGVVSDVEGEQSKPGRRFQPKGRHFLRR